MTSNSLIHQIKNSFPVLQASLNKGWQEFQQDSFFALTEELYHQMDWWYSSKYFGRIPNPSHWYASQLSAKHFLMEVGKLNIYFDTVFPGDFSQSTEFIREDGFDVRRFESTALHQDLSVCIFQLDYIHKHEKFYFTYPPQLSILDVT